MGINYESRSQKKRKKKQKKKTYPIKRLWIPEEREVGVDRLGSVEWVNVIYYYEQNLGVLSVCKARSWEERSIKGAGQRRHVCKARGWKVRSLCGESGVEPSWRFSRAFVESWHLFWISPLFISLLLLGHFFLLFFLGYISLIGSGGTVRRVFLELLLISKC